MSELGRGAMGIVYRARDVGLNRDVALKMIRTGDPADPRAVIRFLAEAEAVAAIRHAHVVQVFEFGESHGRPYFVMEYLSGGTLAQRLTASSIPPVDAAVLVAKLAIAVQAAHDLQIIHRDLKPSNVLFDALGEPKITDFGLAKRGGGADLTRTLAVMGTPAYMAPEQAEGKGKFVGPAADTYALGVILYECLTGVVPFADDDLMAMLRRVVDEEPEALRKRKPELPRDLELICLKCLAKEPAERYVSAAALASDLDRFVRREPVSVRAAGVLEKGYKWARRNPSRAAAVGFGGIALVFAMVMVVLALAWSEAAEERRKTQDANTSLAEAKEEVEMTLKGEQEVRRERDIALESARQERDLVRRLADEQDKLNATLNKTNALQRDLNLKLEASKKDLIRQGYFRSVDLAYRAIQDGDAKRAAELLDHCPEEFRGWEWGHAHRKLNSSQMKLGPLPAFGSLLDVSPVGPWVAGGGMGDRVWDLRTGSPVTIPSAKDVRSSFTPNRFVRDGRLWVSGESTFWDPATGRTSKATPLARDWRWIEAPSEDGRWGIASTIRRDFLAIIDLATGNNVLTIKPDKLGELPYLDPAFSPDGSKFAVFTSYARIEVWEIPAGKRVTVMNLVKPGESFRSLEFRPGSRDLLTATNNGTVQVWEAETGKERFTLAQTRPGSVAAAYSRDGQRIVAAGEFEVRLYDAESGALKWGRPQTEPVAGFAFNPDRTRLAMWGSRAVRILDAGSGQLTQELYGHDGKVNKAAFSSDGRLVTLGEDSNLRVWDGHAGETFIPLQAQFGSRSVMAVSRTGDKIAVLDANLTEVSRSGAVIWDLTTQKPVGSVPPSGISRGVWAAFTPDSLHLLSGTTAGRVSEWDIASGKQVPTRYWIVSGWLTAVHPARHLLAIAKEEEKRVNVWDVSRVPERLVTGARRFSPEDAIKELPPEQCPVLKGSFPINGQVVSMTFSPDGGHLAAFPLGESAKVWNVATGLEWNLPRAVPLEFAVFLGLSPTPVALGMGGTRAVWPIRGELKLADSQSGVEAITLTRRSGALGSAAFSADGTNLYSLVDDGVVVFDSSPRPAFVPQVFDTAPPPRAARSK